MPRAFTALALLLVALAAPARAGSAEDAALESAARISAQLDQAIRDAHLRRAIQRAVEARGVRITEDGFVFIDGPEVPFDEIEWAEPVDRGGRSRRLAHTDTLLRVGPGMTLSLTNLAGDIRVIPWDRNEVRVQAEHDRGDQLVTEVRGQTVRLGVRSRHSSPPNVEWTLTVPAWLPLELSGIESEIMVSGMKSSVRAQSMRGDVTVNGCQGPLEANSVEGEVHITDVRGTVTAGSVNSIVRIVRVTGPVEAQTINGDIQLVKLDSPNVDASTVNGRVYYASSYQPRGRYLFSSHNGKIIVPMPGAQHVRVSMSSFQGQVESSIPMPTPPPAPRARGQHYRFVMRDGVAVADPPTAPSSPSPRAARTPRAARALVAPEIELESFAGLIRLASEDEVNQVLAVQRELLSVRRAALDSARIHQLRNLGDMDRARRLERQAKGRETERRRTPPSAPAPAASPETPPPPPAPLD